MAVCNFPKMVDFWRRNTIFHVPFPATVMSRDRFLAIASNLNISDPEDNVANEKKKKQGTEDYDTLQSVRPLLEMMRYHCMGNYHPKQHISVGERMVTSKARLAIKQYTKAKLTKWGLKYFVLADVNGCTIDFMLYMGKSKLLSGKGLSFDEVTSLVDKDYLGLGYIVYCDNFYTSPSLFQHLKKQGFGACGTSTSADSCDRIQEMHGRSGYIRPDAGNKFSPSQNQKMEHDSFPASSGHCSYQQLHPSQRAVHQQATEAQDLPGLPGGARCTPPGCLLGYQPESPSQGQFPVPMSTGDMGKRQRASMGRKQCIVCKRSTP
ncbi:piggyBac transposable element-derived protein 4 [Oreochromis niloticus]|uniref:PiggyBac transposable element-derived protein 4-like n=1 Tax=Oreochromis niloticus TaxID=8128 RepID=A0A669DS36_ORENI|nr:piggyBac transposable element-derived protein 4-like [Oreochromis niloticus]